MSRVRIMLVDDHRMVRDGLRATLAIEGEFEIVGEAGDGKEAVVKALNLKPSLILMDVVMPGMSGIDACQEIRNVLSECRVVMLTALDDTESVTAALMAGAQGYVLKTSGRDDLLQALRAAARGESVLDPGVMNHVIQGFTQLVRRERERLVEQLTPREKDVLLLVAQGLTNKEIAQHLVISEYTARNNVSNMLGKLGLQHRSELVRWAIEHGAVKLEPR